MWFAILDVVYARKPPVPVISRWLSCGATSRFVMPDAYCKTDCHAQHVCATDVLSDVDVDDVPMTPYCFCPTGWQRDCTTSMVDVVSAGLTSVPAEHL